MVKSKAALKRKYDKMAREIVFARDRMRCRRCGKRPPEIQLQWAHIYSRRYLCLRWDPGNALALCAGCHFWIHANPMDGAEFVRDTVGADEVTRLRLSLAESRKPDLEAIGLRLTELLAAT